MTHETQFKVIGKSIKRKEDARLLTGQALFTDDVELPGMLHAAFLRSYYAHARIKSIDISKALQRPGVVAVYSPKEMGDYYRLGPVLVPPPVVIPDSIFNQRTQPPMAKDMIRHAGETMAVVIAESRYIAEDALADIVVEFEDLPAVVDMEKALQPGSALVHEDIGSNLGAHVKQEVGNYAEARKKADVVIKRRILVDRGAARALENRGIVVSWDPKNDMMTVWDTSQAPIPLRNGIASYLGLSEEQVRVIAPFVGGAFGPKIMTYQPEEVLLPWASMKLCRPIKWIEDRQENFVGTTSERDQVHDVEIALSKEGKILGFYDSFLHDTGAYNPYFMTVPLNTMTHTISCYDIPNFYTECKVVFTNKMIVTPIRGAGRPQGVYIMERMIDLAAKEMGMSPVELRRKNILPADKFPFETRIVGQDFVKNILDSGNYPAVLEKAVEMVDYDKFVREDQPRLRKEGKHVGIGVVCFTEGTAVGPYEGARVTVGAGGKVEVLTGIGTQGQAHFTTFAQVASEVLGVDVANIHVTTGDTALFHWGVGTFASRGMTLAGTAIYNASLKVREKALKLASKHLEVPEEALELAEGVVRVIKDPKKSIPLGELAMIANPLRGAVEAGMEPGLEAMSYFGPPYGATSGGAVAMIVEVDPETMLVEIKRFVIAHDCGTVVNPMVLEGQVHGAVSMGIGNSFYEKMVYDDSGQLLNGSLVDYLLPRATDMPPKFEIGHLCTPSPLNPLGMKGVGEAGAIPTPAAFAQAVENALQDLGVEVTETPLSPNLLFELMQNAKK